ncbi:uncharacterized protein LOC113324238 [Papaver somniferum]|uniref:uncharacterized protein LOC113324238 n=1 Tax=Papaver somniferum TaxID=3469 RepID=UPI000E6FE5E5|nr:uncharacterized protein LOC113324238 [Papaver somniferum]
MIPAETNGNPRKKDEEACGVTIEGCAFTNTYGVASKFAGTVLAQQFFDSLGFSKDQSREASKAIAAIAAGKPFDSLHKEAIVFTYEDICYPGEHLRPLYLTAHINKIPSKRAFVDGGASLNLISTYTLDLLEVQKSAVKMRNTTVKVFRGHTHTAIGIVHLVMKIGHIRGLTPFYVLEDETTFHVLLGRGWLLNHKVVAPTYYQCIKTNVGGIQFRIPSTSHPFDPEEAYKADAVFYDLAKEANEIPEPIEKRSIEFPKATAIAINEEVERLLKSKFIRPIQHPAWLANIVPVVKKNGKIRCCVDYRDLSRSCPKDDFPLPNIDLTLDATGGKTRFSFMDGFNGYNKINMAKEDAKKTAFQTPYGNF